MVPLGISSGNADFNGDGSHDILWRNKATGEVAIWCMSGGALLSEQRFETVSGSAWEVVGIGSFNGDRHPDILQWNDINSNIRICYLYGSASVGCDTFTGAGRSWKVAGVGDFNGDGSPDILWRNSITGQVIVFLVHERRTSL